MDKFFHPQSLAVFGVSDKPMNLASGVLYNLSRFEWKGRFYGVGARAGEVRGRKVHASVLDIEDAIDLKAVRVYPRGVLAVDARLILKPPLRWP